MFQNSYSGVGTRNVEACDQIEYTIPDMTTQKTLQTMQGLIGTTKCTYIVKTNAGMGAPGFMLAKADFSNFQLQWNEWQTTTLSNLNSGAGFMHPTGVDKTWMGTYTVNTFPNPIVADAIGTGYTFALATTEKSGFEWANIG